MAHLERLNLMVTLLKEVIDGSWKVTEEPKQAGFDGTIVETCGYKGESLEFNLATWVWFPTTNCGFSACVVGHACLDSRLAAQGLIMVEGRPTFQIPGSERVTDWTAVEVFFEIDQSCAEWLFNPGNYEDSDLREISPREVLNRLEEFIIRS